MDVSYTVKGFNGHFIYCLKDQWSLRVSLLMIVIMLLQMLYVTDYCYILL